MEINNGKDAFAGSTLLGGDKYLKRHQEALRVERAIEFDKRVIEFNSQNHTLDWANIAITFCDRLMEEGKDLADVSKGFKDLPSIKREAESIIAAEERKIKAEQDKINLQIEENNLRIMLNEDKMVSNMEQMILNLSAMVRDRSWLTSLNQTTLYLKGVEKRLVDRVSNRYLLESFNNEAKDVEKALDLDDEILELNAIRTKNKAWAERVFTAEKNLSTRHDRYMHEKNTLFTLMSLATKIYYSEEFTAIDFFLRQVEKEEIDAACDNYSNIEKFVAKLRKVIYLDDFIDNFEQRWEQAKSVVSIKVKDIKKAEAKKLKEEKEAEIRRQEEAEANRQRAEKAKMNKAMTFSAIRTLVIIAVVAAIAIFGVIYLDFGAGGGWVLGIGAVFVVLFLRYVRFPHIFYSYSTTKLVINIIFTTITCGYNIASIFFPVLGVYGLPMLLALITMTILDINDCFGQFIILDLSIVALGFTLYGAVGGVWGTILCCLFCIASGAAHVIVAHLSDPYDEGYSFAGAITLMVLSLAILWFSSWELFAISICLAIGALVIGVRCYYEADNTKFVGAVDLIYFFVIIAALIGSIIVTV